jgi:hypothetical protein
VVFLPPARLPRFHARNLSTTLARIPLGSPRHVGSNHFFRRFGIDCIAVTPQSSHSRGSPMSQRECAGFNCPVLPVAAGNPVGICPESTNCTACSFNGRALRAIVASLALPSLPSLPSLPVGVAHVASCVCKLKLVSDTPRLAPFSIALRFLWRKASGVPPASAAAGVAQLASIAKSFRFLLRSGLKHRFAWPPPVMSEAWGVGHVAKAAAPGSLSVP